MGLSRVFFWIMLCFESTVAGTEGETGDDAKDLQLSQTMDVAMHLVDTEDNDFPYFLQEHEENENVIDDQIDNLAIEVDNADMEIISNFVWFDFESDHIW